MSGKAKKKQADDMEDVDDAGDWGDDGGDNDAGDWGDDAAGEEGGDDWGGGDGEEFETETGAGGDDADEPMGIDVQIANIFYEAEDIVRENKKLALEKFQQVIELAKSNLSDINDESKTNLFNSIRHTVVLLFELGKFDAMAQQYEYLLTFIPKVTRNEGAEAIETVLNAVSNSTNFKLQESIYQTTSNILQKMPDTERMLFNVNMKLCKTYVDKEDYVNAVKTLRALHRSCQTADGQDDKKNKSSELLEIYALEIKMSFAQNNSVKMKELYEKTKDLSAAVKDPRSQSVIRECWGQMFGDEGQWQRAYAEFYSAFTHYQEIGNRDRAKQCLKYVVIANMLSGGNANVFDAREAKVYQNEPDIAAIGNLRNAYEKCDVNAFGNSLEEINKASDKFIRTHLDSMVRDFRARAIHQYVKSYRRVKLAFLAQVLKVNVDVVEQILVQLILDGEISGRMDQVKGVLDLSQRGGGGGGKMYNALDHWTSTLSQLTNNITHPQLTPAPAMY